MTLIFFFSFFHPIRFICDLVDAHQLKEKMIHSVMPPKVADMLLKERSSGDQAMFGPAGNVKCLFRPFHMASMDNVSILFADIVGFTKMSSKKTAEQLVEILNDLFERFDDLCILNGCEKISTLGDCKFHSQICFSYEKKILNILFNAN